MAPPELGLKGSPAAVGTSEKTHGLSALCWDELRPPGVNVPGCPSTVGEGAANSESHQKSTHQFTLTLFSSSLN